MRYATMGKLGVLVFALVLASFLVRGFGRLFVGADVAVRLATPIALVAAALVVFLVAFWLLARVGITTLEDG